MFGTFCCIRRRNSPLVMRLLKILGLRNVTTFLVSCKYCLRVPRFGFLTPHPSMYIVYIKYSVKMLGVKQSAAIAIFKEPTSPETERKKEGKKERL